MNRYVALITLTDRGEQAIVKTIDRADEFRAMAGEMGVSVHEIYWTLGAHDGLVIFDAPDDTTATAAVLSLGSLGNVKTCTMRAFDREGMQAVLDQVRK